MVNKLTRRKVLRQGASGYLGAMVTLTLSACEGGDSGRTACADPDSLTRGELSMRASLAYTDASPQPGRTCSGCAYFAAGEPAANCGDCEILGAPVSSGGYCESWSRPS